VQILEALCYSQEGGGSITEKVMGFFNWPHLSGCIMVWTQLDIWQKWLSAIFREGKAWPTRKADVTALASHKAMSFTSLLASPRFRCFLCNTHTGSGVLPASHTAGTTHLISHEFRWYIQTVLALWKNGVSTAVTMKNVFWYVRPCGYCKNRRFGGMYGLHHQGDKNRWAWNVSN
jgi:hypothetical protein